MTVLVPFDGGALSTAALEKAAKFSERRDEEVLALTIIPDDPAYALERGLLYDHEAFDPARVAEKLETQANEIAPDATFRYEVVDSDEPTATTATTVAREIRRVAGEVGVSVIFIGTENAGGVTRPLSSVGGSVATDPQYDVYIVRHAD